MTQSFAGIDEKEVIKVCKLAKKYNKMLDKYLLDEVISTANNVIWSNWRNSTYITTCGIVFTYYKNSIGEIACKLSLSHTIFDDKE